MSINWTCPYCDRISTLGDTEIEVGSWTRQTYRANPDTKLWARMAMFTCPNLECRKTTVDVGVYPNHHDEDTELDEAATDAPIIYRRLLPKSIGRKLHDSVPAGIIEDYGEAHTIMAESPKAAATLARRAIQGMIRDFHGISKRTLKAEIDALEELVEPDVWTAIDVVRSVGNIGAHMEKDVNIIIEVEPYEAETLLGLVTLLSDDWYKSKADREQRLAIIKGIGEKKDGQKNASRNDGADSTGTD